MHLFKVSASGVGSRGLGNSGEASELDVGGRQPLCAVTVRGIALTEKDKINAGAPELLSSNCLKC